MTVETPKLDATVRALREVADWLEAHPELEDHVPSEQPVSTYLHAHGDAGQLAKIVRAMGTCRKDISAAGNIAVRKSFGPLTVTVAIERDAVCAKRLVGTRTVTKEVPVGTTTVEVDEPVWEWDCEPILGTLS